MIEPSWLIYQIFTVWLLTSGKYSQRSRICRLIIKRKLIIFLKNKIWEDNYNIYKYFMQTHFVKFLNIMFCRSEHYIIIHEWFRPLWFYHFFLALSSSWKHLSYNDLVPQRCGKEQSSFIEKLYKRKKMKNHARNLYINTKGWRTTGE